MLKELNPSKTYPQKPSLSATRPQPPLASIPIPTQQIPTQETLATPKLNLHPTPNPSPQLYLAALWMIGSIATAACALRPLIRMRRIARQAGTLSDPYLLDDARQAADKLALKKLPAIRISNETDEILAFGFFRPVVLLSQKALKECSPEERRMILAHEFVHISRHDAWFALLPQLAQTLFFFHPMAWLASNEFNFTREAECDQTAIRSMQAPPDRYGRLLLRLGASEIRGQRLCSPGVSSHFRILRRRIAMLDHVLTNPVFRPRRGVLTALKIAALLAVMPVGLVQGQATLATPQISQTANLPAAVVGLPAASKPAHLAAATVKSKAATKPNAPAIAKRFDAPVKTPYGATKPNASALIKPGAQLKPAQSVLAKASDMYAKPAAQAQPLTTSVFTLQFAKAAGAATMLRQLFKSDDIKVVQDDRTNIVVVRATKAQIDEMSSVIKNLDQRSPTQNSEGQSKLTRLFRIKYGVATDIANVLRTTVAGMRIASIAADARTNTLVVVADESKMNSIFDLVSQLDIPTQGGFGRVGTGAPSIHVVKLTYAKADQMLKLFSGFADYKGLKSVAADSRTNSLIITANNSVFDEVMDMIKKMDVPIGDKS
jgi:beta-lactamase regulating signal transducer with metallopeptidase domain